MQKLHEHPQGKIFRDLLNNFGESTDKNLRWSSFLVKLQVIQLTQTQRTQISNPTKISYNSSKKTKSIKMSYPFSKKNKISYTFTKKQLNQNFLYFPKKTPLSPFEKTDNQAHQISYTISILISLNYFSCLLE